MDDKGLQDWFEKQEHGQVSKALSSEEKQELARYDRLWEAAAPPKSRLEVDTDAAWSKLDDRLFGDDKIIPLKSKKTKPFFLTSQKTWGIAAAVVLLIFAAVSVVAYLQEPPEAILAFETTDQMRKIELPDGSVVQLNVNSKLTYGDLSGTRQVNLVGEAFFDVARNETLPFEITTGALKTRVLGTSFNIRAYPNEEQEVSVKSGTVEVKTASKKVILVKQERVVYEPINKQLAAKEMAIVEADVWQTKRLAFSGESLKDVLPILEKYYHKKFIANTNMLDCPYSGEMHDFSLETTIEMLSFVLGATIEQQQDTVIISGDGCLE